MRYSLNNWGKLFIPSQPNDIFYFLNNTKSITPEQKPPDKDNKNQSQYASPKSQSGFCF